MNNTQRELPTNPVQKVGKRTRECSPGIEDESCETYYTAMSKAVPNFEARSSFSVLSPKNKNSYEESKIS